MAIGEILDKTEEALNEISNTESSIWGTSE